MGLCWLWQNVAGGTDRPEGATWAAARHPLLCQPCMQEAHLACSQSLHVLHWLQAIVRLQQAIPSILSWVKRFLRSTPGPEAAAQVQRPQMGPSQQPLCVQRVVDIEESVWAPKYGLKGMIDASLDVGLPVQVSQGVPVLAESRKHVRSLPSRLTPSNLPFAVQSAVLGEPV